MTHSESELQRVKNELILMWKLVSAQLLKAQKALVTMDKDLAREIIHTEKRVNAYELNIDNDCENAFALLNPVAVDLRFVLAVLKINSNLERTGDIAEGIARFILEAENNFPDDLLAETQVLTMFEEASDMLLDLCEAFDKENTEVARTIFKRDELLNEINRAANKCIAGYLRENSAHMEQGLHILSTIRKLERVGDQCKNMAEEIIFYVEAKVLKHAGKKEGE
ncbi:MAG: hypothetical protein RL220_472 [Bacteroidota bacterium]|jgi:phosphate transport system protein